MTARRVVRETCQSKTYSWGKKKMTGKRWEENERQKRKKEWKECRERRKRCLTACVFCAWSWWPSGSSDDGRMNQTLSVGGVGGERKGNWHQNSLSIVTRQGEKRRSVYNRQKLRIYRWWQRGEITIREKEEVRRCSKEKRWEEAGLRWLEEGIGGDSMKEGGITKEETLISLHSPYKDFHDKSYKTVIKTKVIKTKVSFFMRK